MFNHTIQIATLCVVTFILSHCSSIPTKGLSSYPVRSPEFQKQMEKIADSPVREGNAVEILRNGDGFFGPMFADIEKAKRSVDLEMFIIREGRLMDVLAGLLAGKAEAGVEVRVLIDAVGSRYLDDASKTLMEEAGVKLAYYHPIWKSPLRANQRDHRKYLIVDEKIAYVGGSGISDIWLGNGKEEYQWRDTMFRVKGPILKDIQTSFFEHWNKVEGVEKIARATNIAAEGNLKIQEILGNSGEHKAKIAKAYYTSITSAQKEITISMAYSCPPRELKKALADALKRGVRVRALIPSEKTDSEVTRRCGHHFWSDLEKQGAEVYAYQPTMMHVKAVVVDGYFSMIGAANWDNRSFFINQENNLHVYDEGFATTLKKHFLEDLKLSKRLKQEDFEGFNLRAFLFQDQL